MLRSCCQLAYTTSHKYSWVPAAPSSCSNTPSVSVQQTFGPVIHACQSPGQMHGQDIAKCVWDQHDPIASSPSPTMHPQSACSCCHLCCRRFTVDWFEAVRIWAGSIVCKEVSNIIGCGWACNETKSRCLCYTIHPDLVSLQAQPKPVTLLTSLHST